MFGSSGRSYDLELPQYATNDAARPALWLTFYQKPAIVG
jgi:hypothetical protein